MATTFGQLEDKEIQQRLAIGSTLQLFQKNDFLEMAVTQLEGDDLNRYFQEGESVSISRVRDSGEASVMTRRSGSDVSLAEPGYVVNNIQLTDLYYKGFPIYSYDALVDKYVRDYVYSVGNAMALSIDKDIYNKYRTWSLAASGEAYIDYHPPIAIAFKETSGGAIDVFGRDHLLYAGKILDKENVPATNRKARIGTNAKTSFLSDAIAVTGFAGAIAATSPGSQLLSTGMPLNVAIERDGFMVKGSNTISGQDAVADLGDGVAFEPLSAAADDTTVFFKGDTTTKTALGAVRVTVNQTANLVAGVAVGKIARIGAANAAAVAYGVILRVDAANKYVWLVPYGPKGDKLKAADLGTPANVNLSIPKINEVGVAGHPEAINYATRLLRAPSRNSGASEARAIITEHGLVSQLWAGDFNIRQLKEDIMQTVLWGAKAVDYRKSCLLISA